MVMRVESDWFDIKYMRVGSPRQRTAWRALTDLALFDRLHAFTPVLTGTLPIGLDLPASDLDIICHAAALDGFEVAVTAAFGDFPAFRSHQRIWQGLPSVVVNFDGGDFPIEIFAQDRPVAEQNAFRHMVVEARLLALGGEQARSSIMALRRAGMKTEPAFAAHFRLAGDPYAELLRLSRLDDTALHAFLDARP